MWIRKTKISNGVPIKVRSLTGGMAPDVKR